MKRRRGRRGDDEEEEGKRGRGGGGGEEEEEKEKSVCTYIYLTQHIHVSFGRIHCPRISEYPGQLYRYLTQRHLTVNLIVLSVRKSLRFIECIQLTVQYRNIFEKVSR